jgi:hypothetical protein
MKYLYTLMLLALCHSMQAQIRRPGTYTPKPKPEKQAALPPAEREVGLAAGYCPTEYDGGPTARMIIAARTQKHLQLFATADAVLGKLRTDIGFGAGINFPFGSLRSYFYPGIYVGYYIGTSSVFGGQLGYVGYVSRGIALYAEAGYRWGPQGSIVSNGVSYIPIVVGVRITVD